MGKKPGFLFSFFSFFYLHISNFGQWLMSDALGLISRASGQPKEEIERADRFLKGEPAPKKKR